MITLKKFEQSAILLTDNKTNQSFAFDFGSYSEVQILNLPLLKSVFISHVHHDHFKLENIQNMQAEKIFAAREVHEELTKRGFTVEMLVNKDLVGYGAVEVFAFEVDHGPISKPISNLGFHISIAGKNVLFCGDVKVIGQVPDVKYDLILIPVCGGKVIFDFQEALVFLKMLKHKGLVIPIHSHGSADPQSGLKFQKFAGNDFQVIVLDVKQSIVLK